ncbi:MAG: carbohydrate ABC transporter permease [Spirochaetia bacterium]|nr:carbohydrate ABC transporter permease [Spirochaetia bacterium]
MKTKSRVSSFFLYLFLSVSAFFSIFEFFWIVIGSTNSAVDIQTGKLTFGDQLIPNLTKLFGSSNMGGALFNSAKIAVLTVFLSLLVTSMAAYGFQMYKSKARENTYSFFMLTMMIPFASLMIPLFQIIVIFRLLNSHLAIILVASISVFMIFFFRQSFVNYQTEILQAARVDGAGELRIFFTIFFPSMRSTFAAGAIYSFMTSWNAYLWPLIVLQSNDKRTSTLLISSLSSSYTPDFGVIMTGIALATLPVIVVFFAFQKQFVQGMVGSVKQ